MFGLKPKAKSNAAPARFKASPSASNTAAASLHIRLHVVVAWLALSTAFEKASAWWVCS